MSMTLAGLRARVEAATGPDTRLALDIIAAANKYPAGEWQSGCADDGGTDWTYQVGDETIAYAVHERDLPDRSVDAILALIGKVLPGWSITIYTGDRTPHVEAEGPWPSKQEIPTQYGKGSTLPLALCSALIAALEASHDR